MVRHLRKLCRIGQQVVQVSAPARRVLTGTEFAHGRPSQDVLDPAAQPGRGFGLLVPDRLQHLHEQRGVNRGHGQRSNERARICRYVAFIAVRHSSGFSRCRGEL